MAGHSKWANIKHKKARTDAKRGKIFMVVPKLISRSVDIRPFDAGYHCAPPFENSASEPLAVMTVACLSTLAQPLRAAMSSLGSGWLTTDALAAVKLLLNRS